MTAVLTSTNIDNNSLKPSVGGHVFRMADGKLVAIWLDVTANVMKRSTSGDLGVTWTAPATVFTRDATNAQTWIAADQAGDTIYGAWYGISSGTGKIFPFKLVYAAGAFTDTNGTGTAVTDFSTGQIDVVWDSIMSTIHVFVIAKSASIGPQDAFIFAFNTALTNVTSTALGHEGQNNDNAGYQTGSIAVDRQATPTVYIFAQLLATAGTFSILVRGATWNGTIYGTPFAAELVANLGTGNTIESGMDCAVDQNANLDVFWSLGAGAGGALSTRKRTGVNVYSTTTTLVTTNVEKLGLSETRNANADIFVVYSYSGGQTNGEIYYLKRTGGAWGAATRMAGGANTGWDFPSPTHVIQGDGNVNTVYRTGTTAPFSIVFDNSVTSGNAPSAPINVLPSGNANTSLTPTTSSTYKNTQTADGLGKYRVLVIRVSDSVTMWDTGVGGTAYTGAAITDGGTFSIAYAGTGLAKGIAYQIQFSFWDALGNLAGPLSTAVTFQINDAPVVTITGPTPFAAEPSSGLAVSWTYTQTLTHAQSSFQVKVLNAGQTSTIYDSGVQTGAATSWTVPTGTLANATAYVLSVTATSTDGL